MMTNRHLALHIIRTLRNNGFQAYFAGGCVRDMLLGKRAKDYDVATDAHPEQVIRIFPRTLKVGAKFGVVMVMFGKITVEVATFRTETGYTDGRHPSKVEFADVKEDAVRRDFTINGLYYDPVEKKVIDFVKGQKDLKRKIIRAIGEPGHRFGEDYLRMLRAVRFSTRFGYKIEKNTWAAICHNVPKIKNISRERIAIELEGILTNPNRSNGAKLFVKSGLAHNIFDGLKTKDASCGIKVLAGLGRSLDFELSLAAFFCKLDSAKAYHYCKSLKLSNGQLKHIKFLLEHRGVLNKPDLPLANLKIILASPYFNDLYSLEDSILKADRKSLSNLKKLRNRAKALVGHDLTPAPLLNGHELVSIGAAPGPQVGLLSRELYVAQLSEHIHTKTQAREWAEHWLNKHKNQQ